MMFDAWQKVYRCKECGKIYKASEVPIICGGCGAEITGRLTPLEEAIASLVSNGTNPPYPTTDHSEIVTARRLFFTWEVREDGNMQMADKSDMQ